MWLVRLVFVFGGVVLMLLDFLKLWLMKVCRLKLGCFFLCR